MSNELHWQAQLANGASDLFRVALEAAPTGMIMVDARGAIVLVNAQIERLFQYERNQLIGKNIELLVPERFRGQHPKYRGGFFAESTARPMGAGRDLFGLRADGSEVPIEIGLNPLSIDDAQFVLCSVVDITERRRLDEALRAQLREREVLLQEVHHRVKNNLQVISSLINLQLASMAPGPASNALEECSIRVQAIALIHEQLYQSQDFARVPFDEYAQNLAASVARTTGVNPGAVALELNIEPMSVAVDVAIPCGLILSELITNAFKHAFRNGRIGKVSVRLQRSEQGQLMLDVTDNGIGLPEGFDPKRCDSLGMQLILTLAEQIRAEFSFASNQGAQFTLRFNEAL
jgi:PAS domain S-box-containing protein